MSDATGTGGEGGDPKEALHGLQRAAAFLEKANLLEWVTILNDPKKNFWVNFLAGVARGAGMVVGATLVGAVFALFSVHLLKMAFRHAGGVPWVGAEMKEAIGFVLRAAKDLQQAQK